MSSGIDEAQVNKNFCIKDLQGPYPQKNAPTSFLLDQKVESGRDEICLVRWSGKVGMMGKTTGKIRSVPASEAVRLIIHSRSANVGPLAVVR
jgi:hypothetical protein